MKSAQFVCVFVCVSVSALKFEPLSVGGSKFGMFYLFIY